MTPVSVAITIKSCTLGRRGVLPQAVFFLYPVLIGGRGTARREEGDARARAVETNAWM